MTPIQYNIVKDTLSSILPLNHPIEQIAKYVIVMHKLLHDEWGFLCEQDILTKLVDDTAIIGLSRSQIKQLLMEEC